MGLTYGFQLMFKTKRRGGNLMQIFIDADGCPVVNLTIKIAKQYSVDVVVVKNFEHKIESDYATVITVDKGPDSADYAIVNRMKAGDLVITQDYGLGAMVLAKQGLCLTQNGYTIEQGNIDQLLNQRHQNQELRRKHKIYNSKPRKRSSADDDTFKKALTALLENSIKNN